MEVLKAYKFYFCVYRRVTWFAGDLDGSDILEFLNWWLKAQRVSASAKMKISEAVTKILFDANLIGQ